jgi:hypothetical protein
VRLGGGWNWLRIVSNGGFGISGVEPSDSAISVLVSKMDLREIGCEDDRCITLLNIVWRTLVSAV